MFKYLYGPVSSWRLGKSLGIDLISQQKKICNFDCTYCQIGKTDELSDVRRIFVKTEDLLDEIKKFNKCENAGIYFTFSGRGEPTLALNLIDVIKAIKKVRKEKIAVITNSSNFHLQDVRDALKNADIVMAKFDVWNQILLEKINNPFNFVDFKRVYNGLKKFRDEFRGILELQIMFVQENKVGYQDSFELIKSLYPNRIQINTPLRPCDEQPLTKDVISIIKKDFNDYFSKYKTEVVSVYDIKKEKILPIDKNETCLRRGNEI